jgi:hypothetical protein
MTTESHSDRQLQSAIASLDEVKGTGADCPGAARIWESATGQLPPSDDKAVVSHLGDCGSCSAAWRIAHELVRDESPVASVAPSTGLAWRTWVPIVAAASVVIAVVSVVVLWFGEPVGEPPVYRTQQGEWLEAMVPPGRVLSRDSCVLRWAAGPEGTAYDLLVTGDDLQPLARAVWLERPEYAVTAGDLASVPAGGSILWRVTAHLPDGRRVVSRTFTTQLE